MIAHETIDLTQRLKQLLDKKRIKQVLKRPIGSVTDQAGISPAPSMNIEEVLAEETNSNSEQDVHHTWADEASNILSNEQAY